MRDENRECPRCDSREVTQTEKRITLVIDDWPHKKTETVIYWICEECDLVFGEKIW